MTASGHNLKLPQHLNSSLPVLKGKTSKQALADNLNTRYPERNAFVNSKSSERVRKALHYQIRTLADTHFCNGRLSLL